MAEQLVVIGNGMAPGRVLDELLKHDRNRYQITIFNAESRVNYDRIMLSPVLSGEKRFEEIVIHGDEWYARMGITLHKAKPVIDINRKTQTVTAVDGTSTTYDKLLIATGSRPFIPPFPGVELAGVLSYRDLDDVDAMIEAAEQGGKAVVIGGGLLGLEAAAGLKERGMATTVIHLAPTIMERQLDTAAGMLLEEALVARGINVVTQANTKALLGDGRVSGVELDDGRKLEADVVVVAVGITPNVGLAEKAGLDVKRGIVVGDDMRTSDERIFAVGECVEHRGKCYGLVAPLYEMARVVAAQLVDENVEYQGSEVSTKLKVTGIDVYSAGDFAEGDNREAIVLRDASEQVYKRLTIENNRIIGVVLFGEARDGPWFFQQLREGSDISDVRDTLIFGENYAGGTSLDPTAAAAVWPDDAKICGCSGVGNSNIVNASEAHQLTRRERGRARQRIMRGLPVTRPSLPRVISRVFGAGHSPHRALVTSPPALISGK